MGQIDEQKERRRLTELYAKLEEEELEEIAADANALTPAAREALRSEMLGRRMQVAPEVTGGTEASASSEARGKEREDPGPVLIGRYRDTPAALIAKSMLDSAGIESFLADENLVRMDWLYSNLIGGIKLMVREVDAETARKLLEEKIPEKFDVAGVGEYAQPRCPQCGSLDVGFDETEKEGAMAAMALLGVPLVTRHKGGTCHACGHEWGYDGGPSPD
jgi:hypothetical protein